ncbi:ketosteroid isomerase [Paramesorhizobium deserti]|uniref:Ketosteroid isomerase n=1 Tax=Paramesorhizobium deserti TaxID=1494590 RepID=A0A135HQJ7_9HYPH|nr:nuclear transport factor 2 family protein [Paramesorhizobium deserti]KXF75478.1 ketosteroid isomerase [Paramesorhizobium deserti]
MVLASEKHEVEGVIAAWSNAISNKDAEGVRRHLTNDIVQFTLAPPLEFRGDDAEDLEAWFSTWRGPIGGEARNVEIAVGDQAAFSTGLIHMSGTKTDGENVDLWFRQTLGLKKVQGSWKIAHVHTSVPFYMDGSFRAAIDLKP